MKRLPLLWRVFLSTTIVTTALFGLIGYVVNTQALRMTKVMVEDELRSGFRAYQSLWTSRAEQLASISKVISGMPDVRAAFGTSDAATIRDTAGELWGRISRSDAIFIVTDPNGNVIASLSGSSFTPPKRIDAVAAVSARFPQQGSGFAYVGDRLFQLVVTPVYVESGHGPGLINVLVAGHLVDDAFAFSLKNATAGSDWLILAGDRVVASTAPAYAAARVAGARLEPDHLQQISAGEDAWSVLSTELAGVAGGRIGEVRVFRPFTTFRTIQELGIQIAMIWALAILFALFITFVLTRRLLLPIRLLDSAAQEVSRGNYDCRVPAEGSDEMGRLGRTFNAMLASIRSSRDELIRQERITTLGRVASSIVHDLRNPLAAIYGGAEMLIDADGLPASHTKRLAENIYRASGQIRTLLDDLTAITRGKAPELETCRIADVVDDAWSGVEPQAEAAGVEFSVEGARDAEAPVSRARVERVFVNLFANAIQAMPTGGRIRVRISRDEANVFVRVQDSGPGVPAAIRENLFQPFTTSGKSNGLGLGLALSRHTLLDHGGDLSLGATDSGACFCVTLPLQPAAARPSQASDGRTVTAGERSAPARQH